MTHRFIFCLLAYGVIGCQEPGLDPTGDPAAPDPAAAASHEPDHHDLTTSDRGDRPVRGYRHSVARSRLRLGRGVQVREEHDLARWVGSEGVFAIHTPTGETRALLNADAPALTAPIEESPEAHARRVVDYFRAAGLPQDQIGQVRIHVMKQGSGPATPAPDAKGRLAPDQGEIRGLYAVLTRQIEGIPVVDSVAWASMNIANEVLSEEVRWPEISRRVVDEAHAMAARAEAGELVIPGLAASLRGTGRVVIRHATASDGGARHAFAAYDVNEPGPGGRADTRHFGPGGEELKLPRELATAPSDRKP